MKRILIYLSVAALVLTASATYLVVDSCSEWQDRYKRFLYAEMMKSSPVILTPDMIERVVGPRPLACERPSSSFTDAEVERYRREGVGPNEFADELRNAN